MWVIDEFGLVRPNLAYAFLTHQITPPYWASARLKEASATVHLVETKCLENLSLLARLVISKDEYGKGLGAALLKDAFQRAIGAAKAIAGRAIVVHAIDDKAVQYYEHFDFGRSPNNDHTLMILMEDVRAMLGG